MQYLSLRLIIYSDRLRTTCLRSLTYIGQNIYEIRKRLKTNNYGSVLVEV